MSRLLLKSKAYFILTFICITLINCIAEDSVIKEINAYVTEVDKNLKSYDLITISQEVVSEGAPPAYKFYQNKGKLVLAEVLVGHETWSNSFKYYFQNEQIVKYLKATLDRPDNPPRKAIIYNLDGKIIWKNIEKTVVQPKDIQDLFNVMIALNINFSEL